MRKISIILILLFSLLWVGNGISGGLGLIKIIKDEVKSLDEKVKEVKAATTPPAAPSNLQAQAVSSSQIDLSWTDSSGDDETGFVIERKTGEAGTWSEIDVVGTNMITYSNIGLSASTTYHYRVYAYSAAGNSGYSNQVSATTDQAATTPPVAPSNLQAQAVSSGQIDLSWRDNSDNETGFVIERKTGNAGTWSETDTVEANVTTYSNTGLTADTLYCYRVKAYNLAGDSDYPEETCEATLQEEPAGTKKWDFLTSGRIGSSPAIAPDGTIYVGSEDKKLYAIYSDGSKYIWRFSTGGPIGSSPAIGADGTIYVGSEDEKLHAIYPDGRPRWEFRTGYPVHSSPAIGPDGTIYVGSLDMRFYAIDPDGKKKWEFLTGLYIRSSPAIGPDGTIYIGSLDKKLYAISPDGRKKWEFSTGGRIVSSPAIASDGTIYIGSEDNKLYAIYPDGTKKWDFSTSGGIGSSPAIASDGTIYIGSEDKKLYAINSSGSLADTPWPMFRCNLRHTGRK